MNGRRTAVGLCVLCALLVSAFAAQSASSATKGTTSLTCVDQGEPKPGGTHSDAHCKSALTNGRYRHVAIAQDTTTEIEITSEKTNAETTACTNMVFKYTIGGVSMETITCNVHGTGWMENKLEGNEHYSVSHVSLTLTEVKSKGPPGCEVFTDIEPGEMGEKEVIHTQPLKITTKGQGDSVKIEPTSGTTIARFWLTNCTSAPLNATYSLQGSFTCEPEGATITCEHAAITTQNTFKLNGSTKAGLNGPLTVTGRANEKEPYTPLSTTTFETA